MIDLQFRVWNDERKCYFRVLVIDFEKEELTLTNGIVRIWRKFDEVDLERKSPHTDIDGQFIFEGDYIGHKGNMVTCIGGNWCVNGDRGLWLFVNEKVIGSKHAGLSQ